AVVALGRVPARVSAPSLRSTQIRASRSPKARRGVAISFGRRSALALVVLHGERPERIAGADQDVLSAVELVCRWAIADGAAQARVPERVTCRGVERDEIRGWPAGEEEVARRGQDPRA